MNTIAFIILLVEILFYLDTQHKYKGCLYDIDQMWCYSDLKCTYPQDNLNNSAN